MKTLKKILAIVLTVAMMAALNVTAFAADTSTLTIDTAAKNHTYEIYQLLKGNVSDSDSAGNPDTLANIKAGANLKDMDSDGDVDKDDVDLFIAAIKAEVGEEAIGNKAAENLNTAAAAYSIVGDDTAKSVTVDNGYYIIVDTYTGGAVTDGSDTVSRYMVNVVGNTTVEPKVSTPSIDKDIIDTDANAAIDSDKKVDTAAIGDTINFEITSNVPDTTGYEYYYYVVNDTMSEGLTLDEDSFAVKIGDKTLTKGTDYFVYVDGQSFQLGLADLKDLVDNDTDVNVNDAISIKYNAVVNEKAAIGTIANTNTAKLVYSNNPNESKKHDSKPGIPDTDVVTGEGPNKVTKTYVTEVTIVKTNDKGMPLPGAEFTLTGTNLNKIAIETATVFEAVAAGTGDYYKLTDGTYTKTAPVEETKDSFVGGMSASKDYVLKTITKATQTPVDATSGVSATTDADGVITFVGLNAGTYKLVETKTPEGYNTADEIDFTITASGDIVWTNGKMTVTTDGNNVADIVNYSGTILPSTGGIGTTIFYVAGAILLLGAGILLVTKKRVGEEE